MVETLLPSVKAQWDSLSFASTLYLHPIIDTLLDPLAKSVPPPVCYELRLGLQEALVNAAKHGNRLNPAKQVCVRYARHRDCCWWIVSDQGAGFSFPCSCGLPVDDAAAGLAEECGRGLFILDQIFDEVRWDQSSRSLHLRKQISAKRRWPVSLEGFWLTAKGAG